MITAKELISRLDLGRWLEAASPENQEEVRKAMEELNEYCAKDKDFKRDLRSLLARFVKGGQKLRGTSNCNVLGTHVTGSNYGKDGSPAKAKIISNMYNGEMIYAEAIAEAVDQTNRELQIKLDDNKEYTDLDSAVVAHQMESLMSKGPYDGGTLETPYETVRSLIDVLKQSHGIDSETLDDYNDFLTIREAEYKRCKTSTFKPDPNKYVVSMAERGISKTMRGNPFSCAGNKDFRDEFIGRWNLLWRNAAVMCVDSKFVERRRIEVKHEFDEYLKTLPKDGDIKDPYHRATQGKYTVDLFLQDMLVRYFANDLDPKDWWTPLHGLCVPINRNQGRGFNYKSIQNNDYTGCKLIGEREDKGMKYRPVVPAPAWVNALMHIGYGDLVANRPKSDFSVGLSYPEDNDRRMKRMIRQVINSEWVLDPLDFSNFDFTIPTKLMHLMICLYDKVYDGVRYMKNIGTATALLIYHKVLLFPEQLGYQSVKEIESANNGMVAGYLNKIKGDPRHAKRNTTSHFINLTHDEYDFRAFYVSAPHSYLISGIYLTNAIGSDCSNGTSYYAVPMSLYGKRCPVLVTSNGDDILYPIPLELWKTKGFDYRKEMSEEFARRGFRIHPTKQSEILLNGKPLCIFAQLIYPQDDTIDGIGGPRKNFLRQVTSLPYDERVSRLALILQYIIPISRIEAGVDKDGVEYAGKILGKLAINCSKIAKKYHFRPKNSPDLLHKSRKLGDHSYMIISEKNYNGVDDCGGFKTMFGLIKEYGQDFIPALGRTMASIDYLEKISGELELRAPHKEKLREILQATIRGENVSYHFYSIDAINKAIEEYEKFSGVEIENLRLVDVDALVGMGTSEGTSSDDLITDDELIASFDF
jgi:hypothetical protein